MLALVRIFSSFVFIILIYFYGLFYCLFHPKNTICTFKLSKLLSRFSTILGIHVELRYPKEYPLPKNCIYIANHQSNYDSIAIFHAIQPNTITLGKKSLLWIPLFGLLYWLSGNVVINRNCKLHVYSTLIKIKNLLSRTSIWIFPEGTRNKGKELLPFKAGAFYLAVENKVPVVPVCISKIFDRIKLNRKNNGLILIEILSPINTECYNLNEVRLLSKTCYNVMKVKIDDLNSEIYNSHNYI